ncbi:MAG TPA: hypothetical protein VF831_03545, partial [Anaerolineales bacterium]
PRMWKAHTERLDGLPELPYQAKEALPTMSQADGALLEPMPILWHTFTGKTQGISTHRRPHPANRS